MKTPLWSRILLIALCTVIIALPLLSQNAFAAEEDDEEEDDGGIFDAISDILDKIRNLPENIAEYILDGLVDVVDDLTSAATQTLMAMVDELTDAVMNGLSKWIVRATMEGAESIFTSITASSANVFNYSWFKVIVGVFSCFGILLFAVGVVLAFVDVGIEYRRRGADIGGAMLNLGKGLLAVGLFSTVPVPLYKFCVNIQSVIMKALAINWSFQGVVDALCAKFAQDLLMVVMTIVIIVLMIIIYLDTLKRGGILLVQICIGSLYMISVPRGYMDNFFGWCKQVIALCLTTLFQNLLMFCGLMTIPTNLFLGIGIMVAAKEVPRICGQFGLDTSVKANFTGMAMGANASIQAIKAAATLLA